MTSIKPIGLPPDIEIARKAKMLPIEQIGEKLGIHKEDLELYGPVKAKVSLELNDRLAESPTGKLILVTAITPTPAGEGKTTTSIGLVDALNRIGHQATACLREPSMGPCFGMKGGAAGGGYAQVCPDGRYQSPFYGRHSRDRTGPQSVGRDDRQPPAPGEQAGDRRAKDQVGPCARHQRPGVAREVVVGLGGISNSLPHESTFDITVASEVMAAFCLSESLFELRDRLGKIVVAETFDRQPITAAQLKAHGAMAVLLKNAIKPNLVQTLENNPVFIHGGPFANIAHGCNSVLATKLSMRLSEYTVTEAGFGADLGAEKFFNIKCRKAGISPDAVIIVATVRALKMHGGVPLDQLSKRNDEALEHGIENLKKHIENIHRFGLPVIVAINSFATDTDEEIELIENKCAYLTVQFVRSDHWARGGEGAEDLARATVKMIETTKTDFSLLYPDTCTLWQKVGIICREIYGATDVLADKKLRAKFRRIEEAGFGHLPVCIAKTQYSLSTDPGLKGWPKKFDVPLRDVRVSAGAGFVVVLAGDVMTMPGLPEHPSAESIDLDENGNVVGLF